MKKLTAVMPALLVFHLISCFNKHDNAVNTNSNAAEENQTTQKVNTEIIAVKYSNKGILIGDSILLYDEHFKPLKNISFLKETIIEIISKSDKKINLLNDGDECNDFSFVKIKSGNTEGWVSGKFVFEFKETEQDTTIVFADNTFSIITTRDFGTGAQGAIGLSDCGEIYPVLWFDKNKNSYSLIHIKNTDDFGQRGFNYFCLRNDDGGEDFIKNVAVSDSIIMNLERPMQTGKATYKLVIHKKEKEKLIGRVVDFKYSEAI